MRTTRPNTVDRSVVSPPWWDLLLWSARFGGKCIVGGSRRPRRTGRIGHVKLHFKSSAIEQYYTLWLFQLHNTIRETCGDVLWVEVTQQVKNEKQSCGLMAVCTNHNHNHHSSTAQFFSYPNYKSRHFSFVVHHLQHDVAIIYSSVLRSLMSRLSLCGRLLGDGAMRFGWGPYLGSVYFMNPSDGTIKICSVWKVCWVLMNLNQSELNQSQWWKPKRTNSVNNYPAIALVQQFSAWNSQ